MQSDNAQSVQQTLAAPSHFVRAKSGLVKGLGTWNVFVFNVLGYATGLSLATNPTFLGGLYPNANIYWTLAFGFILSFCSGWTYGMFAALYPRNGGDYIYISRSLSPGLGFVASWGFTWSQIYGIGVFAGWAFRDAFSPAFVTMGYVTGSDRMVTIGRSLATGQSRLIGGLVILIVCLLLSLLGQRMLKACLNVLFLLAMLSAALMVRPFLMTSPAEFNAQFDAFMLSSVHLQNAHATIMNLAVANGLKPGMSSTIWDSLRALPVGFLIFFGFTYSVYLGGEVREPMKSQSRGILAALGIALLFSVVGMGAYYNTVGRDFNNAVAIVNGLSDSPLPAGPSMTFFAGVLEPNPVLAGIATFGCALWFILLPLVMIQLSVRNVFAWAFDRVVPPVFATVLSDNRAWPATLAVVIASVPFLAASSLMNFPYINYTLLFSVCFCVASIAGIVVPFRKKTKADFDLGPPLVRLRVGPLPFFAITSAISAAMFLFLVWSALTNSAFSGVRGVIPHIVLAIVYGVGVIVWALRRYMPGRRPAIDPETLYGQLPPE